MKLLKNKQRDKTIAFLHDKSVSMQLKQQHLHNVCYHVIESVIIYNDKSQGITPLSFNEIFLSSDDLQVRYTKARFRRRSFHEPNLIC